MIIKTITVGAFQVNNYIIACDKTKDAVIIDAGGDFQAVMDVVEELGLNLKFILNTHGHLDHIAGDYDLQNKAGVKVYAHKEDEFLFNSLKEHLQMFGMPKYEVPKIDFYIEDGMEIELGELKFKVIHTPGHSLGSVCYLVNNELFSGDTLFLESVGRTDLPGGSYEQLQSSIVYKLFTLDENINVYPGHGPTSTIKHEKESNPFFGQKVNA